MSLPPAYPGDRLGLPERGPGAVASLLRRLGALVVDWFACQLIAVGLLGMRWGSGDASSLLPMAVLLVEYLMLVSTIGTTLGMRLLGIRVRSVRPGAPAEQVGVPPQDVLLRTVLLLLVVPALLQDPDGRGLHDRVARTVVVRS